MAAVLVALLTIPLVFCAALGVDTAAWHSRVSFLQKSADAAAAAGAVWMPNIIKATDVAYESLARNGIVNGVGDITVTISEGATSTSLRVVITDHSAERYLSKMVAGEQVLTSSAEAEYFLPLPLGSPLNYFGGVRAKTDRPVTWPVAYDWAGNGLATTSFPCNVGTSSGQNLGRWTSASAYSTSYSTGQPQCLWTAVTGSVSATPWTQHPTNVPCNVDQAAPAINGRWVTAPNDATAPTYDSTSRHTSGTGNRQCTWVVPNTKPADHATRSPSNKPCNVTGELADGSWTATTFAANSVYRDPSASQTLCRWTANLAVGTNPIAVDRNPRFWGQIHGPGGNQQSGDAYSTKCQTAVNCVTPDNDLYLDPSDPNQGYWFKIHVPDDGGGLTTIKVFDASLTAGSLSTGTGDSVISGSNMNFTTSYKVYKQTNPIDFNARVAVAAGVADNHAGSCNWDLRQEVTFRLQWIDLCTINMSAGDMYLINVRSAAISGVSNSAGRNSYAIEVLTNNGAGVQPALHAYKKMVMYNNVDAGIATFYVAEVKPEYAGKTLVLELYDPGESSGQAWLYPMMPSPTQTGAVDHPPLSNCSFSSSRSGYPRESDLNKSGVCSVRASDGGALYNGYWVTIRVTIPADYTCTADLNPEVSAGSCWWGIQYDFGGATTDTTTWQARVEGNPVHLTQ
ncbi:MAG: hypothetical protein WD691_09170 [Acidimicrobiales bacterium]